MTETIESPSFASGSSAGAILREARERQGMHIAMLAAMMKVTPNKIEALEADRYDELPDLAFARALAKTVCRTLKVDPEAVLAKLPSIAKPERLEHTAVGLNTPFREGGATRHQDGQRWALLRRPVFWGTFLVLVAAALLAAAPPAWLQKLTGPRGASQAESPAGTVSTPAVRPAAIVTEVVSGSKPSPSISTSISTPGVSVGAPAATPTGSTAAIAPTLTPPTVTVVRPIVGPPQRDVSTMIETVHDAPRGAASGASAGTTGVLVIRARAEAWVDVSDARGRGILARSLQAGETISIDGDGPFKLRLGNAPATEVRFRGEVIDLASRSDGVLARFELK